MSSNIIFNKDEAKVMASQKLTNCCVAVIVSLLRRTYETLHATSTGVITRLAFGAFCLAI